MSEIDEKMKLEKITKLLEKGGTMLANHHDCGAPMFRYQGKIMCPVCESGGQPERRTEKMAETKGETIGDIRTEAKTEKRIEARTEKNNEPPRQKTIRDSVLNKVMKMAESLDNEQDLQRVKDKFECIEQGIKILRLLENPSQH